MLQRNPRKRLGCPPQAESNIKDHEYFKNMDWIKVEDREIQPEFVPRKGNENSAINFDSDFTNQQLSRIPSDKKDIDFEKFYDDAFHGFSFYNSNFII